MLINVGDLSICNLEGFIAIIQYHRIQERGKEDLNKLLLHAIFDRNGNPFVYLLLTNDTPL